MYGQSCLEVENCYIVLNHPEELCGGLLAEELPPVHRMHQIRIASVLLIYFLESMNSFFLLSLSTCTVGRTMIDAYD